jgi:hypothetical protein
LTSKLAHSDETLILAPNQTAAGSERCQTL